MQGAAAMAARRARGPGRGRLDRRDRRAARRRRGRSAASPGRAASCASTATGDFSEAIRTTDKFAKEVAVDVALPSGTVRLTAQAKGAGMISPDVRDDAVLRPDRRARWRRRPADLLLGVCVKRSFDRVSVDGQLSTNDTVILQASGASGVTIEPESRGRAALRRGARLGAAPARAADRARRRGREAGRPRRGQRRRTRTRSCAAARAVANSPLVKAALHGGDPNWGRIAQAVGAALPDTAPLPLDIWIEDVQVCAGGHGGARTTPPRWPRRSRGDEVEYDGRLPGEGAEAEVFFSDLSHEYVTINADYTT